MFANDCVFYFNANYANRLLMKLLERTGLADMQSVYKLQGLYLQCLYVYMKYTRPGMYQFLSVAY